MVNLITQSKLSTPIVAMQNDLAEQCASLQPNTFGHAYWKFMSQRGFEADDRPPVRFVEDEDLAYVIQRSREVHDLWHVLFDCHTNIFGELALKAVEFVQVRGGLRGSAACNCHYQSHFIILLFQCLLISSIQRGLC